jgi:hypothetical protein
MYDFTFPVHGKAAFIVTPQSDRAIPRTEPIKPSQKIAELALSVGDMFFHVDRRRTYVIREIGEHGVRCVFQRSSGDFAEEEVGAFTLTTSMRLVEKGNPEYWHSYLLKPQGSGKTYRSKPTIVGLFMVDERIRKIGQGKHLAFHKEDIKEHYSWYKF